MKLPLRSIAKHLQLPIFIALIFLVPTNLFLKFFVDHAYVSGLLVDYLMPKLYLSDIFLMVLIGFWCIELGWQKVFASLKKYSRIIAIVIGFSAIHLLTHLSSPYFVSSVWFSVKLLEMWLFLAWLIQKKHVFNNDRIFLGISWTIVFQFVLGLYQYLTQRSFFGYWFFGEPMLAIDPTVAKSEYSGALKILPYGTTPHPNILAGTLVMLSLLCLYLARKKQRSGWYTLATLLVLLSSIMTILTESLSAGLALVCGLVIFYLSRVLMNKGNLLRIVLGVVSAVVLIGIPLFLILNGSRSPSFLRRHELETISLKMFAAHPAFGSGLNLFTTTMNRYGNVSANLQFLQPVHNIPLLLLAETGLFGVAFIVLILYIVHKKYSVNMLAFVALGVPYLIILSLDHYPLSVQSGMLLSAIIIAKLIE